MRSNENARNARITIVVTRVTIVVTRVVTPRSLRITIVVTPCPLQPHYNPVTTIVRRFSALQDKGVVTTVVTKIVILRCTGPLIAQHEARHQREVRQRDQGPER